MSILDNAFNDKTQMQGAIEFAGQMNAEILPHLDEKTRHILELTSDGTFLGDALGISREQRAALLDLGCRLIQMDRLEQATDVLLRVNQLDPMMAGALYGLGVICQLRGELQKAAFMYTQFLALDATNPIGYLRLAECLLAAQEFSEAKAAAEMAKDFAEEGKGEPGNLAEALRLLSVPEIVAAELPKLS